MSGDNIGTGSTALSRAVLEHLSHLETYCSLHPKVIEGIIVEVPSAANFIRARTNFDDQEQEQRLHIACLRKVEMLCQSCSVRRIWHDMQGDQLAREDCYDAGSVVDVFYIFKAWPHSSQC